MKKLILFAFVLIACIAKAQTPENPENQPKEKAYKSFYLAGVTEVINGIGFFETGQIDILDGNGSVLKVYENPSIRMVPRFSAFFHTGEQAHFQFSKNMGFYTGLGVRNVGMVNRINDTITLKQRAYTLGIPAAIKIGNMAKRAYLALGGEIELFFHFKQKSWIDGRDNKVKFREWFSNRTELINPSVFAEVNFGDGSFIKLRYYPMNWLRGEQRVSLRNGDQNYTARFTPTQSNMLNITVGKIIPNKDRKKKKGKAEIRNTNI
jgi:hypothetical protein